MSYIIDRDTIDRNGYSFTVEVWADQQASPDDQGMDDAELLAAYERGDWQYVGVKVIVDAYPTEAHASVWAVEYGDIAGKTINLHSLINDPHMTMTDPLGTEYTTTLVDGLIDEAMDLIPSGRLTLTVKIALENAAFEDPQELASILRRLAERIDSAAVKARESATIRDTNGATVGSFAINFEPVS